jgi:hypothetical protein
VTVPNYPISAILSAACFNRIVEFGAVPSSPRCKCPGRRSYPSVSRAYVARVGRFVQYLGQQDVIRSTVNSVPEAPSSLIAFREWLLQHRGLAPVTVDRHEHLLKQMLPALGADTGQYTAATGKSGPFGPDPRPAARLREDVCWRAPSILAIPGNKWRPSGWPRPCSAHRGGVETVLAAAIPRLRASRPAL